jgi:hypothetical protein
LTKSGERKTNEIKSRKVKMKIAEGNDINASEKKPQVRVINTRLDATTGGR